MKLLSVIALLALGIVIPLHAQHSRNEKTPTPVNPLLESWKGDYGGVPDFSVVTMDMLKDAILKGIGISLQNYNDIANNLNVPTFKNTTVIKKT